jgi:hypothetical protein
VIGLGGDPDGQLAAMCNHFWPVTDPSHDYGIEAWFLWFTNPLILSHPARGPPDGLFVAEGTGLVMYQRPQESFFGHWLALKNDDHAYVGSWLDNVWYRKGQRILDRPAGYGIGSNEWWNYGGVAVKGDGWWWNRKFLGASTTLEGLVYEGEAWGPSNHYNHVLGKSGTDADFLDCYIHTRVELKIKSLLVTHRWKTPGNTFPSWSGDNPVVAQVFFTRAVMDPIVGGVQYKMGSQTVTITSDEAEEIQIDRSTSDGGWDRVMFMTWKLEGEMTLTTTVEDGPEQPELPPEPFTEFKGSRWTLGAAGNGGRQTLQDGAHAGGGYGVAYVVRNDDLYVQNSFGNYFRWEDKWTDVDSLPEPLPPPEVPLIKNATDGTVYKIFKDRIERYPPVEIIPLKP